MSYLTSALPPLRAPRCVASGWELHRSCAGADGTVICPSCSRVVATQPDARLGDRVRVVRSHRTRKEGRP